MQIDSNVSRRSFIKTTAAVSATVLAASGRFAHAEGSETLKVGLIGCGGRGTGAAKNCIQSSKGIEIYAMGDLYRDRLDSSYNRLKDHKMGANKSDSGVNVTEERKFVGFDAFQKVLDSGVDMVILACPPHFRPMHFEAAINAGKHVFMEKPVAVDPVGVRKIIAVSELAEQKRLAVVAGTQRRHSPSYIEVMKRIQDGAIGEVVSGQCYWNMGGLWLRERKPGMSDMEWQTRNWLYFTWLSGDHIVEQHIHQLDVVNWALGTPVKCMGMGGRQVRTDACYGNIFDHFAVEYEYANGARITSMCRQTPGTSGRVTTRLVGTKGVATPKAGLIEGQNPYRYDGANENPMVLEHRDLIASIRSGNPLNVGKRVAESTLTAIMGRMSAYTGRELSWSWTSKGSQLDLSPATYEFGDLPVRPVAIPGKTKLV